MTNHQNPKKGDDEFPKRPVVHRDPEILGDGQNRIVSDPKVMVGKPVLAGTRITVESILERLGAGEFADQILQAHPRLSLEDLRAALSFAARALEADVVYPTSDEAA